MMISNTYRYESSRQERHGHHCDCPHSRCLSLSFSSNLHLDFTISLGRRIESLFDFSRVLNDKHRTYQSNLVLDSSIMRFWPLKQAFKRTIKGLNLVLRGIPSGRRVYTLSYSGELGVLLANRSNGIRCNSKCFVHVYTVSCNLVK